MRISFLISLITALTLLASFSGCKKSGCTDETASNYDANAKKDDGSCLNSSFSKGEMLQSIAEKVIVPAYQDLKVKADQLKSSTATFTTSPNLNNLTSLQTDLKSVRLAWQCATPYEFGPAANVSLRGSVNTFPTDTAQIESNIVAGNYNLGTAANVAAKGFPALDYLLHNGSDNSILALFTTDANASSRLTYLTDVTDEIQTLVAGVTQEWENGYVTTFKNSDGTDVGSSLGLLVNELNFQYELIKNAKVGIPLGKKTLGTPLPEKTEAFYAGYSVELILKNVEATRKTITANNNMGLDDYLDFLGAEHSSGLLSSAISSQFDKVITALENVPDPLSKSVIDNKNLVENAHSELQKMVVLLKADMPSAMGVLITYQDNDGD